MGRLLKCNRLLRRLDVRMRIAITSAQVRSAKTDR